MFGTETKYLRLSFGEVEGGGARNVGFDIVYKVPHCYAVQVSDTTMLIKVMLPAAKK